MKNERVAVVTGAGQGIGRAIAIGLAEVGYSLALIGRNQIELAKTVELCESLRARAKGFSHDLCDLQGIKSLVSKVRAEFHTIDLLVNNAGIFVEKPFESTCFEEAIHSFTINYFAVSEMIRSILPILIENANAGRRSAVINIGSSASRQGYRNGSLYAPTKAALRSLTESLRLELQGAGIAVSLIEPGVVNTKMHDGTTKYDTLKMIQPNEVAQAVVFVSQQTGSSTPTNISLEPRLDPRIVRT